ncbi:MAG: hypothetical protein MI748_21200 [Opitutales bacterium]|nr:hypothetical protein [Opitutales bacterium]
MDAYLFPFHIIPITGLLFGILALTIGVEALSSGNITLYNVSYYQPTGYYISSLFILYGGISILKYVVIKKKKLQEKRESRGADAKDKERG